MPLFVLQSFFNFLQDVHIERIKKNIKHAFLIQRTCNWFQFVCRVEDISFIFSEQKDKRFVSFPTLLKSQVAETTVFILLHTISSLKTSAQPAC